MQYEYETISIDYNMWTGKSKYDYLEIINERGSNGWRFVCFSPTEARTKTNSGIELVFERVVQP